MTLSSTPFPDLQLTSFDFDPDGLFSEDVIGDLHGHGGRLCIVTTDHPGLSDLGPVVVRVEDEFHAIFWSKQHINAIHEFLAEALETTTDDHEVMKRFISTLFERSVLAFTHVMSESGPMT